MLEKKLEQASQASVKDRRRIVAITSFVLLCAIAMVMLISGLDDQAPLLPASEPQASSQQNAESELRNQFMQRLQAYEAEVEADLSSANLKKWDQPRDIEITTVKDEAISAFAVGAYASALGSLIRLETLAGQALAARDSMFASEVALTRQAVNADDYTQGKLHISKALLLKQDDEQAQVLEAMVEKLPELLSLLKAADVAAIENNLEKEHAAVAEAFNIAPQRQGLKERRDALHDKIRESRFTALIAAGLLSLEKKQISAARRNYAEAKALFPQRSELKVLKQGMISVADELDLKQTKKKVKKAIDEDQWQTAEQLYAQALQRHPEEKAIRDGLQLASRIVALQRDITDYIQRPERLASANIFAAAEDKLIQATVLTAYSRSLAEKSGALKDLLASMSVKIPVFVKSDNQTYIVVKGVGKVGLTHGREIALKPGVYTFEGSRSGYRSKLVQVRLPVGKPALQVEVVCDERI
ncbi:hypothetical protein F3F96_08405 [Mariprofundus sp. NF]|uniref:hypothetical protein n=1 Tax=Mariprofundus sp. NF TaxID=2608716 RepID=UPI0015A01F37|nr:hypothetical protein [Mariprofundus sp. NF]NWF39154.1 hypothetical protein [Mariprofundus sp. NF]